MATMVDISDYTGFNAPACEYPVFQKMAQKGVLIRLLDNGIGICNGLPANEKQWQSLNSVPEYMQLENFSLQKYENNLTAQ